MNRDEVLACQSNKLQCLCNDENSRYFKQKVFIRTITKPEAKTDLAQVSSTIDGYILGSVTHRDVNSDFVKFSNLEMITPVVKVVVTVVEKIHQEAHINIPDGLTDEQTKEYICDLYNTGALDLNIADVEFQSISATRVKAMNSFDAMFGESVFDEINADVEPEEEIEESTDESEGDSEDSDEE